VVFTGRNTLPSRCILVFSLFAWVDGEGFGATKQPVNTPKCSEKAVCLLTLPQRLMSACIKGIDWYIKCMVNTVLSHRAKLHAIYAFNDMVTPTCDSFISTDDFYQLLMVLYSTNPQRTFIYFVAINQL